MAQTPLASALADIAAPLAASIGLELWGIEIAFGGRSLVRVFVEGENGASIDQCAELSRLLSLSLDVEDIIPTAYVLEVSSPGLERTFFTESQLARAVGKIVDITLHEPQASWPGRRKFRGRLRQAPASGRMNAADASAPSSGTEEHGGLFLLEAEGLARPDEEAPLIAFSFADLKKAVQVHFFPEQTLPGKPAGKKHSQKKTAKEPAREDANGDAAATNRAPDTQGSTANKQKRRKDADIPKNGSDSGTKRGSDTEL